MGADPMWAPLVSRLVEYRKAAGMTQTQVAEAMGVSQVTVSEFERCVGVDGPRVTTVQRYARAVGAKIVWRIGERANE